ncbi:hypothetical protein CO668_30865 [Rhizobium anhuiense]|uniref:hypothetical protein n=1 Tax=Rhizobium anhuiense TaxID=1184720 RepID=UPI000BE9C856|nr:hypothetical protein [Rhizobium anhuiense]PDS41147.1 hypothetical protein CO668_30865 [Rhizobium anhuiense]
MSNVIAFPTTNTLPASDQLHALLEAHERNRAARTPEEDAANAYKDALFDGLIVGALNAIAAYEHAADAAKTASERKLAALLALGIIE